MTGLRCTLLSSYRRELLSCGRHELLSGGRRTLLSSGHGVLLRAPFRRLQLLQPFPARGQLLQGLCRVGLHSASCFLSS